MPSFWIWDLRPLSPQRTENRTVDDEISKGKTKWIQIGRETEISNIFTGEVNSTRPIQREFYRPTDRDLEILQSAFPDDDSENPSWNTIEAELVAAGHDSTKLRPEKAPTLVRFLKIAKTADVAHTLKTKPPENPPATQSQSGTESKDPTTVPRASFDPTVPDATGYVASPSDPTSYVPMARIRADYCDDVALTSIKEIRKVLENFPTNRVRWTRPPSKKTGSPHPQRLSVHLVDWEQHVERLKHRLPATTEEGFLDPTPAELEDRKAIARRNRNIGK